MIVTWRNFIKNKLTNAILLVGLVIGIACFIMIQLYVDHQKSVNSLFADAKEIYRINLIRDENKPQALTPLRLANELTSNFDKIKDATRISRTNVSVKQGSSVYPERALFVDENYFEFFDFQFIEGDIKTALKAPDSIVLHEVVAKKYFGTSRGVIGKRIMVNGNEHQITGVIEKTVTPHTMPMTLLLPIKNYFSLLPNQSWVERWNFNATITFAKISSGTSISQLTEAVSNYYDSRAKGASSYKSNRVEIEPLLDIYLNNVTTYSLTPPGSKLMLTVFTITSLMILILACVNYTNLSTAAAMRRGKDVGVRKAIGASRLQLVSQYLFEAILITLISTVIAIVLVAFALPQFNSLMNTSIEWEISLSSIVQLSSLVLVVGLLAGSYPAFYLSSLSPAQVLKGLVTTSSSGILLRKTLIVFQFGIAAFLIASSLVVNWQMQFIEDMPQGFERDNVIVVSRGADIFESFKTQASRHPEVVSVTMSHTVPTKPTRTSNIVRRPDNMDNDIWVGSNPISYDFFETYGIKILAGRDFSKGFSNDPYKENKEDWPNSTGKLIINQALATDLGWSPQEAIGQMLTLGGAGDSGLHSHQVIGVVEDTHYINVKNAVPPMTYVLSEKPRDLSLRWVSIRLKEDVNLQVIRDLESLWLGLDGNLAFKYDWLSEMFTGLYRNETLQTKLLNIFTALAIAVTIVGLFGLAAFNTQKRVKEIAIRKVLGAETGQLCFMLINQFSVLVIVGNVVALPIAYFLIVDWLNNFIYRIDLPYSAFALSAILSFLIAYITVGVIAYKAAKSKPVLALARD